MTTLDHEVTLEGPIVEEEVLFTLVELCQACETEEEYVVAWVQEGVLLRAVADVLPPEGAAAMARLHDGMDGVLRLLKDHGVRLAVFTGKGRRTANITLEELGIAHYFEMVVTGNDVVRHKPDPEGISRILSAFGVPPGETIMVGDSMADVRASRQAGVAVAAVLWDAYDRQRVLDAGLDLVFETVPAFMDWCRSRVDGHVRTVPTP